MALKPIAGMTCAITIASVPPALWLLLNLRAPARPGPGPFALTMPLIYLTCVSVASAVCILLAFAIRKRTTSSIALLVASVSAGALLTSFLAFSMLLTLPTGRAVEYPPTAVTDQTSFAKVFYELHGSYPRDRHGVVRRSTPMDEYGLNSEDGNSIERRWGQWEEYGLPFRCFRSPMHFGLPRPPRTQFLNLLPSEIIPQLHLVPIPFFIDTLFFAGLILVFTRLPRQIISRHRRQEGRCIRCGYLLKDLRRCPECGTPSHAAVKN